MLKNFVRAHPRLNAIRKFVRFLQSIPLPDCREPRKVVSALRVRPFTRVSYSALAQLWQLAQDLPAGAFVECGVWNGGSAGMIALADRSRRVWLFDSWEGLPEPGPMDVAVAGHRREKGWNLASLERVEELMLHRLRLPATQVRAVKGWFDETLPAAKNEIGQIALLHLDADWYDSTRVCLRELHEQVVVGGVVVVDDYLHWQGCKQAVDEFLGEHGELELHVPEGGAAHWWR